MDLTKNLDRCHCGAYLVVNSEGTVLFCLNGRATR